MIRFATDRCAPHLPQRYRDQKARTIPNHKPSACNRNSAGAETLALAAIGWVFSNEDRAERYLTLTGLDPDTLRQKIDDSATLRSVLDFLANHEPDLVRAAEALAVTPEELIAAQQELEQ